MDTVYTVNEVAEMLHYTKNWVYLLIRRGEIPAYKFGDRYIRIPEDGLKKWIEQHQI